MLWRAVSGLLALTVVLFFGTLIAVFFGVHLPHAWLYVMVAPGGLAFVLLFLSELP